MQLKYKSLIGLLFFLSGQIFSQNFYDQNTIQKIELQFNQANWDYQLDTSKAGKDGYIMAKSVTINGVYFDSVGVKYKGNSSYNPSYNKNPLHIELDGFKNQSYLGIKDIKLGNNYADPSMIREVLGYDILKKYMHCPEANFAKVYVNGTYYGLYSNTENIGKQFYSKHYSSSGNIAIKCNPLVNPSTNAKSNLKYFTTGDSSNYFNFYEIKSDYGWNYLRALADTVTNHPSKFADNLDVDRVIWMLAFNNVNVNLDSYSGAFCQNYYLYKDNTNHYNPTIWDLNMCFGGFPYLGVGNSSLAQLSIANMQQLPISIHATDTYWPMINIINANPLYKRMLIAHMRTITNECISNNYYYTKSQQFQNLIDTSVLSDNNKFYTYQQFQNGLTANVSVGSYSVPGISNLMSARLTYLQNTIEFSYATPTITAVSPSNTSPTLNTTITITATILNATTAYLGYRHALTGKFTRIQMYDDGLHNDGGNGDNVYGTELPITSTEANYYVYAENNNTGMFSPERSEHEYYTIQANVLQPEAGQVVINEFLAVNQNGETDDTGELEDWIELYNTSNVTLNLSGLYLSDSYTNPQKYIFPNNTIIAPQGFLTIWADEDNATTTALHCNFKLSASGEQLILSKGTTVLDSLTFGSQIPNISEGRCPDGTGIFETLAVTSYNIMNCALGVSEFDLKNNTITVFPNPANQFVNITSLLSSDFLVVITNSIGEIVYNSTSSKSIKLDATTFNPGIYFVNVSYQCKQLAIKLIIIH